MNRLIILNRLHWSSSRSVTGDQARRVPALSSIVSAAAQMCWQQQIRSYAAARKGGRRTDKFYKIRNEKDVPATNEEENAASAYLADKFKTNLELSSQQWDNLKCDIVGLPLGNRKLVNKVNVDSVILKEIINSKEISIGKSFYEPQSQKENASLVLKQSMLKLFIKAEKAQVGKFEDFVVSIAHAVIEEDHGSNMYWLAVEALARTGEWKEIAGKVLKENPYTYGDLTSLTAMTDLVIRAFQEGDYILMWKLMYNMNFTSEINVLRESISDNIENCHEKVYINWIGHCEVVRQEKGEEVADQEMEKLFLYLRDVGRQVGSGTQAAILEYYKHSIIRHARLSRVNRDTGTCIHCKTELGSKMITQQELDMMKEALVKFVIKKENIYQNTNPQEFDKFLKLLDKEKALAPFDIVIDGLNVSLAVVPAHLKTQRTMSLNLHDAVRHFSDQGCKVLVIHRDNIKKTPHYHKICKMATVVTLGKVTQDDPFMILAALHSGRGCRVLTNDYLRQHYVSLAKGAPSLASLFIDWQTSHQIRIQTFLGYSGARHAEQVTSTEPRFVRPTSHSLLAQHTGAVWHIPTRPEEAKHGLYIPLDWLCIGPAGQEVKRIKRKLEEYGNKVNN